MPTYIDRHLLATIPSAVQQQMHREAMRGIVDPHGVQPLGHWVTDRVIYCVLRAPSEERSVDTMLSVACRATGFGRLRGCAAARRSKQKRRRSCAPYSIAGP